MVAEKEMPTAISFDVDLLVKPYPNGKP